MDSFTPFCAEDLALVTPDRKPWSVPLLQMLLVDATQSAGANLFEDQVGGGIAHS